METTLLFILSRFFLETNSSLFKRMNFDRLPELAQIRVLSFLNVKEKIKIKQVSKNMKFLIEKYLPLKSLCVYSRYKPVKVMWAFDKETITDQEMVEAHFQSRPKGKRFGFDSNKL